MKFTQRQIEFIEHRLAVPEALHEVMCDAEGDELANTMLSDVELECARLSGDLHLKPVKTIVEELTPLREFLLRDAIEGSTWVTAIPNDMPEEANRRSGAVRAAEGAVEKLRACGFKCGDVPVY